MEQLTVFKIGGNVIDNAAVLDDFLKNFSAISGKKILVHGGGKIATELSKKLGIVPKMVDGRRITDAAALQVVTMVYAGLINKNIVAKLQSHKSQAIGLSGADANLIYASQRAKGEVDFGFVGDIESVNVKFLKQLLDSGFVPVICSLAHDGRGQILNVNADTISSMTAISLAQERYYEVKLMYIFEENGVLSNPQDPQSVIPHIRPSHYESLKADNVVSGGMIPKLDNAFDALRKGVASVVIGGVDLLKGDNPPKTLLTL
ncbi:MAG: acetylglutamate kinase [Flammeovirgaceae bacterium]